jgi:phosphoserine phosphatase
VKLLVLDVEGTLFEAGIRLPGADLDSTIWQAIAHSLGGDAIAAEIATHQRWERGEYANYMAWMEDTIAIHRRYGLSEDRFRGLIAAATYNPGVADVLPRIDRSKYEIVLISGGFRELAARVQRDFSVKHAFAACEYLFGDDGLLCSWNLLPCDFAGKLDFVQLMLREYGLDERQWVFLGDGKNDVQIAERAPYAIGYRPHPALERACRASIMDFGELLRHLDEAAQ